MTDGGGLIRKRCEGERGRHLRECSGGRGLRCGLRADRCDDFCGLEREMDEVRKIFTKKAVNRIDEPTIDFKIIKLRFENV